MKLLQNHEICYIRKKEKQPLIGTERLGAVMFSANEEAPGAVVSAAYPDEEDFPVFLVTPKIEKASHKYWLYWNE